MILNNILWLRSSVSCVTILLLQHSYVVCDRFWCHSNCYWHFLRCLPWNLDNHWATSSAWLVGLWGSIFLPLECGSLREFGAVINAVLRIRIAVLWDGGFLRDRHRVYVHCYRNINRITRLAIYTWNGDFYFTACLFSNGICSWFATIFPLERSAIRELTLIARILNSIFSFWQCAILWNVHNIRFWLWQNVHCYRNIYRGLTWEGNNNLAILCARIVSIWFIFRFPLERSAIRELTSIVRILNNILSFWQILALWHVDFRCTWVNNFNRYFNFLRSIRSRNSNLYFAFYAVTFLRCVWFSVVIPLELSAIRELILIGNAVLWLRLHALWHSHNFSCSSWRLNSYRHVDNSC